MINWYVIAGLVTTSTVLVVLLFYVLPKNIKELLAGSDDKLVHLMRVIMFATTTLVLLFSIVPTTYQVSRIHTKAKREYTLQDRATLHGGIRTLSFGMGWIAIHMVADILIRRDRRNSP